MIPISVCIIAKNEEKYIGECLKRLSRYDWEIIVADTGSSDRTVEIARRYTPHVFHFDWINDFSAAKNFAVSRASNDYILTVDCDEYLETDSTTSRILRHLYRHSAPGQIGMIKRLNPSTPLPGVDAPPSGTDTSPSMVHDRAARFFNRKYARYEGIVHEQLVPVTDTPLTFIPLPLTFYHAGYGTMEIRKAKTARNLPLLEAELLAKGDNPYTLFQLGQSYFGLSDYAHALPYFERALELDVNEQEEYVQTLVESYGYCLLYLKQYSRALELEGIYPVFSKRADFVFLMGLIYMNNAMFENAISEFLKATQITDYAVEGVNSFSAYYNAGVICECLGQRKEALEFYKQCGNYAPALERGKHLTK